MKMKEDNITLWVIISFIALVVFGWTVSITNAATRALMPNEGGTGIATTTAGNIGNCLKVLNNLPFLYELGSCGSGGGGSGATTTINGVNGPTFLFTSSSSAFTYSTSTGRVNLNLSTTTLATALQVSEASTTNWNSFYNTPSTRIIAGANCTWVGNTFNCTSSGGSGLSTTSPWTNGELAFVVSNSAVSSVATGTLTETITGASLSATRGLVGGAAILSLDAGFFLASTSDFVRINTAFASSTALNATAPLVYTSNTGNFAMPAATGAIDGYLTSANFNIFNNKLASTSIDTCAEYSVIFTDETGGCGGVVLSASPTFTGIVTTPALNVTASSTLGYASSTSLTVSSRAYFNLSSTTHASTTSLTLTNFYIGADALITDITGSGLTVTGGALTCATGSAAVFGCLPAADWTIFNNKVSSTSIDTSAELAALLTDETGGAGFAVFSIGPTFTGTPTFQNLYVSPTGTSTLGYASSTSMTVSNNFFFNVASGTVASTTALTVHGNIWSPKADGCATWSSSVLTTTGTACGSGGGGAAADWNQATAGQLSPSTTIGIGVRASSTISDLTMINATTTRLIALFASSTGASTTNLTIHGNIYSPKSDGCASWASGVLTSLGVACAGGGSKWTDAGAFTYLTETTDDLALGATVTSTAPFWWDVSATTSYIGNGGAGDSVIQFGPTSSPWTIGFDDTNDSYTISSSTALGSNFFQVMMSTSSVMSNVSLSTIVRDDVGYRVSFGADGYYGRTDVLDHVVVRGRIRKPDWFEADCPIPGGATAINADTALAQGSTFTCPNFDFFEDGTETLTAVAGAGFAYGQMGGAVADGGSGTFVSGATAGWMRLATSTPSLEVTARIGTIVANSSTTQYFIGFVDEAALSTTYETPPAAGCFFTASTTQANWRAICRTALSAATNVDTGVASTSINTGAGNFLTFRIDADSDNARFYIKNGPTGVMNLVADISGTYPATTPLNAGLMWGRTFGTQAIQFDFLGLNVWWRKYTPS